MQTLSVCMIVKNEEEMLARALESVKDADEIIVCDTGSEDRTVEIARTFTDKVYTDFVWCDDFAAARNHANNKATGDWILVIDADERLREGGMALIREAIEGAKKALSCNVVARNNTQNFYNVRVYRNTPEIKWCQPIHNYLNVAADVQCEAQVEFGYSPAHANDPDRALRILSKTVEENPECVRERYYLAREHWYRRDYEKAVEELDQYLSRSRFVAERADAFLMKARCLWALRRGEDARNACLKALSNNANFKEAVLFMADMSWEHNAKTWRKFAESCTNEGVLFVRVE
jgi:glycosyltransferase involved in cell wall biosynthesis